MKVLYVGDKYDYMRKERGLSHGYYNFYDSLVRMNNNSNQVIYFPVDEMLYTTSKNKINEILLKTAVQEQPNIVFFALGSADTIKKETVKSLSEERNMTTFTWMPDDQWAFETYSKHWAHCFDWVATTDYKAPAKYKEIGYQNAIKSQWACNHFLYKPLTLPKIYEVTFVGSSHGNRKKIVQKIKEAGIDVKCWGSGWEGGRISQDEMIRIFSRSKINLNFTKNSGVLWKELACLFFRRRMHDRMILMNIPTRIMDSFKAFPACMWNNQIKGRNFEIPGCAGFCLTEHAEDLENYYRIGKEIETFSTPKEAVEKIRYYLDHEQEREAIASQGYRRTLQDHTYEKRFNEIFKIIGLA